MACAIPAGEAAAEILTPSRYLCFDTDATTATGNCNGQDSPFKNVSLAYFHFKDFEDRVATSPGVTMASTCTINTFGCPYISTQVFSASGIDSVDEDDGAIDGFGRTVNGRGHSLYADRAVTFTFDVGVLGSLPTHVGVVWTDGGFFTLTRFEAWDADGRSLGLISATVADGSNSGTTAEDHFFGATHFGGISAMRIENVLGGIELDHLQYGGPPPSPRWIGFGSSRRVIPAGTEDPLLGEVSEKLVRWQTIVGIPVPGDTVGEGRGLIRGAETPWTSTGGFAELSLTRENLRFTAEGLALATGDAIGTPGSVTEVLGTIVCDTDGSAWGHSAVVETPLILLDKHGKATFNGSVAPLPLECFTEPDIAFLVRIPPRPAQMVLPASGRDQRLEIRDGLPR